MSVPSERSGRAPFIHSKQVQGEHQNETRKFVKDCVPAGGRLNGRWVACGCVARDSTVGVPRPIARFELPRRSLTTSQGNPVHCGEADRPRPNAEITPALGG